MNKLREEDIAEIERLWYEGLLTQGEIAKRFGVSSPHISKILSGKKWSLDLPSDPSDPAVGGGRGEILVDEEGRDPYVPDVPQVRDMRQAVMPKERINL